MSRKHNKVGGRSYQKLTKLFYEAGMFSFSAADWIVLFRNSPHDFEYFSKYCPFKEWSVDDWVLALRWMPELKDRCLQLENVNGADWVKLLYFQPELAGNCDWNRVAESDWLMLLRKHPSFIMKYAWDWSKIPASDWVVFLQACPESVDNMPRTLDNLAAVIAADLGALIGVEALTGCEWRDIIVRNPRCFKYCDLKKLSETDWMAIYPVRGKLQTIVETKL